MIRVVGHYCHDTLIHPGGRTSYALGGSSSYISAILNALGVEFEVVSRVGKDFRYADQVKGAIVDPVSPTTHFTADFTEGERKLSLGARCAPILPEDIRGHARVSLACGLIGEILPETFSRITASSDYTLVDIQGLIRADRNGTILHRQLAETPYLELLDRVLFLKASVFESQFVDIEAVRARTILIITEGEKGCTVYERSRSYSVPAYPATEIDPTGAGDCFMAGYAYGLLKGMSPENCARIANYCGALAVSQVGVPVIAPEQLETEAARPAL